METFFRLRIRVHHSPLALRHRPHHIVEVRFPVTHDGDIVGPAPRIHPVH